MSIWQTIEKFKKQYHLAKRTASLISGDKFNLNLNFEQSTGLKSTISLPAEEKLSRFMVCIRPFANPEDDLYFKNIIEFIITNSITVNENIIEKLKALSSRIERGPINFQLETESYTALDLFLIFSKAEYFDEDKDALKTIENIRKIPIIGQLANFQFHNYAYDVYRMCAELYRIIRDFENENAQEEIVKENTNHSCIYCKSTVQTDFNYPEHVFPESLGNTELVLEKGVVCDICNNGILSQLDTHLVEHDAISMLKVLYVPINTKTGKYPKATFQNWKITKRHPRKLILEAQSGSKNSFIDHSTENQAKFTINTVGRNKFDPKMLARSLYKISLGVLCLKYGRESVLDQKYDLARDFILGKSKCFPNSLLLTENITPNQHVSCSIYYINNGGTISSFNIFGLKFLLNLEPIPKVEMNEQLMELGAKCFKLDS